MQNEFVSKTVDGAIWLATSSYRKDIRTLGRKVPTKKNFIRASAPSLSWGPWVQVWAQFGVIGPDADQHVSHITLSFSSTTESPSTFDVEIKGGDRRIRIIGPGSQRVTVTGNVATAVSARFRSYATPQNIVISTC